MYAKIYEGSAVALSCDHNDTFESNILGHQFN